MSFARSILRMRDIPLHRRMRIIVSNARCGKGPKARIADMVYFVWRFLEGARRVETASYGGGLFSDDNASIEFGGNCPVQGYGTIGNLYCYYRSRGEGWSFGVFDSDPQEGDEMPEDIWHYEENKYFWPAGGWVSSSVSRANIAKAVRLFAEREISQKVNQ